MSKNENLDIYQELEGEARLQALRDNAMRSEEQIVTRPYTQEELNDFKDQLAENSVTLSEKAQILKDFQDKMKAEMKPHQEHISSITKNLRLKYSENIEEVFMMDDQHEGTMTTFDAQGKFVSQRRLTPKEKQLHIASYNRDAV